MRRRLLWISISAGLAAPALLPVSGVGAPLSERISGTEQELRETQAQAGVLTTELSGLDSEIASLSSEIGTLLDQESALVEELEVKQAELEQARIDLDATRQRLEDVKARLAEAETLLAERLVEMYKTDEPDALTVVLESDGFEDLLERTEYLDQISDQDQDIVTRVRELKVQVEAEVARLEELETRIEVAVGDIIARRNELAAAREELTAKRAEIQGARDEQSAQLAEVRQTKVNLEGDLSALTREQARIESELAAAQEAEEGAAISAAPVQEGSGGLIWPVDGAISSPFGMRWGRAHEGVDISVPAGTPIRAAASGNVVTAGPTGGYGNYVCIQHSGGLSTCYAHLSSIGVSAGSSVGQGDVIGEVGCTGSCFGDHLHFETRQGGGAVDPMGYL
jgi:murein DD-endopeptidase MepM/ murein hydrolase activator NlpD